MNQQDRINSFSASGVFPAKTLQDKDAIRHGRIVPLHLQLCPTNRCNLNCSFCSCSERDRGAELPLSEIIEILETFAALGTRAVTITGGGEPLMHPFINEIIESAKRLNIKVGIVTNGLLLDHLASTWPTWIRVSASDDRELSEKTIDILDRAVALNRGVDWNFSYVVSRTPKIEAIKKVLRFAHGHQFAHVRLVTDILDFDNGADLEPVRAELAGEMGNNLVIYQSRAKYTTGAPRCLIILLKPGIAADGSMFPCCGAQYAQADPSKDYGGIMSMGHWRTFIQRIANQDHFNGSSCVHCYYDQYNQALAALTSKLMHEEFV